MKGLLLISHGTLAEGLYRTTELFLHGEAQFDYCCLADTDSPDEFEQRLRAKVHTLDTGDGVLILADLKAGTPANRALVLTAENPAVKLIVGMNLPLVLYLLDDREAGTDVAAAIEAARAGLSEWNTADSLSTEEDFF